MFYHGAVGHVYAVGSGPGPINVLVIVELPHNRRKVWDVIIPRGNLSAI